MATFEYRTKVDGQVQAIRVKVRRAGLPHLSRTFKVQGDSKAAVARADREARAWVSALASSLAEGDGLREEEGVTPEPKARMASAGVPQKGLRQGGLASAFARSASQRDRGTEYSIKDRFPSAMVEALASHCSRPVATLVRLAVDTGLTDKELLALRWQQIALDTRTVAVIGLSGAVLRRVPLTDFALEALLASGARKYGPVFRELELPALTAELQKAAIRAGLRLPARMSVLDALRREAALRWLERGSDAWQVARMLGVADVASILQAGRTASRPNKEVKP